jgi:hypothetical protein
VEAHREPYLASHEERFAERDGPLGAHVPRALETYLECGRLVGGFARVRCGDCGSERLLAFSCQTRNLCPSCQGKRSALLGESLVDVILAPVPHTHVVCTIPKALRGLFQRDRRLLGILSRSAYRALVRVMQAELETREAVPGFVASLQTFGSFGANWHPHVHGIVSEGLFERDGTFHTLWRLDLEAVAEEFRRLVIQALQKARRLSDDFAESLLTWEHSGFSVKAGRQSAPREASRIEEVGRYLARAPMPQDLPEILPDGQVLVPTPPDPRTGATEVILDPLEFLHRIVMQIPDRGQHLIRYYGAYSCRGRRAHARMVEEQEAEEADGEGGVDETDGEEGDPTGAPEGKDGEETRAAGDGSDEGEFILARRRSWARLIRRVFEVDPLECPDCGGEMKIIAVITDPPVIDRIIRHLEVKAREEEAKASEDADPQGPDPPPEGPILNP